LYKFTRRVIKLTAVITEEYHLLSASYKILSNILLSELSPYMDEGGSLVWVFGGTDQLLIRFLPSSDVGEKMGVK
jgi:hypothetical protein